MGKIKTFNTTACSAESASWRRSRGFTPLNLKGANFKIGNLTGFTLTELLVVIVVVGILISSITIWFNSSRMAIRDAKRVSDIKTMQEALELYKINERSYPSVITASMPLVGPISGLTFLQSVPSDPKLSDGSCGSSGYQYSASGTTSYLITYCLAKSTPQITSGTHYAKPKGIDVSP